MNITAIFFCAVLGTVNIFGASEADLPPSARAYRAVNKFRDDFEKLTPNQQQKKMEKVVKDMYPIIFGKDAPITKDNISIMTDAYKLFNHPNNLWTVYYDPKDAGAAEYNQERDILLCLWKKRCDKVRSLRDTVSEGSVSQPSVSTALPHAQVKGKREMLGELLQRYHSMSCYDKVITMRNVYQTIFASTDPVSDEELSVLAQAFSNCGLVDISKDTSKLSKAFLGNLRDWQRTCARLTVECAQVRSQWNAKKLKEEKDAALAKKNAVVAPVPKQRDEQSQAQREQHKAEQAALKSEEAALKKMDIIFSTETLMREKIDIEKNDEARLLQQLIARDRAVVEMSSDKKQVHCECEIDFDNTMRIVAHHIEALDMRRSFQADLKIIQGLCQTGVDEFKARQILQKALMRDYFLERPDVIAKIEKMTAVEKTEQQDRQKVQDQENKNFSRFMKFFAKNLRIRKRLTYPGYDQLVSMDRSLSACVSDIRKTQQEVENSWLLKPSSKQSYRIQTLHDLLSLLRNDISNKSSSQFSSKDRRHFKTTLQYINQQLDLLPSDWQTHPQTYDIVESLDDLRSAMSRKFPADNASRQVRDSDKKLLNEVRA